MKAIFTIILTAIIFNTASANNIGGLKIGSAGKSTIEAKYTSNINTIADVTITNKAGEVIKTQKVNVLKGENTITLLDVSILAEGTYTVTLSSNNYTTYTQFVNFNMDQQTL